MPANSSVRRRSAAAAISVTLLTSLAAVTAPSASAATGFTPGNVVVYRVGDGGTALGSGAAPVFLDEYSPAGQLVSTTPLPTTNSGANKSLTASGSAGSEGLLSLSADGRYLIAPGYNAAVGTAKISGTTSASTPRTVARVDAAGNVDTSTALTDAATGNNPRSATSSNGSDIWVGGAAGGPRYTTIGASTSTELDSGTYKNVRQVLSVGGQLYASADPTKAGLTIATIGTGNPSTSGQSVTNLNFDTPPSDPYAFAFLTLNGTAGTATSTSPPDTLYVADQGAAAVVKYGLINGVWTQEGSVPVSTPEGLTANDVNGTVSIYVTSNGSAGTSGTLSAITDASGVGGQLTGTATTIATLPANEAARGVAFTPGTAIGSGGGVKPPQVLPSISAARSALPAALGDSTQETLPITVGDSLVSADQLTVTAASSDETVAASSGISITGTGAARTLAVTPGAVGVTTITLTVTTPDRRTASTSIRYGVSADLTAATGTGQSPVYYSGAANASAAVDVGDGYAVIGDDETSVLHLYDLAHSGAPVASFDFTSQLPFGSSEVDIEGAARSGDVIYWEGSMSNKSGGDLEPSRSTLFATKVTGSGAATTLSYLGAYTGLQADLINWDASNGHGLGANYLGFAASSAAGVGGHESDAFNVEGLEFVGNSTTSAYLGFRAPLEPTTDRHLALLVPVTNLTALADGSAAHATFGAPVFLDLGGYGVRDIKENAAGQYLISAGTADDTNTGFALYSWDGDPAHAPRLTGTTLPQIPSADNAGSWETIVSVPSPLTAGAPLRLIQDDGDVVFYGDGLTSKTGTATDLQKAAGVAFTYTPPAPLTTTISLTSSTTSATPGKNVTFSALVTGPAQQATPAGGVTFSVLGADGSTATCPATVTSGSAGLTATCTTTLRAGSGPYSVQAAFTGTGVYAGSVASTTLSQAVSGTATSTSAIPVALLPKAGTSIAVLLTAIPSKLVALLGGSFTVTVTDATGRVTYTGTAGVGSLLPIAVATVPGSAVPAAGTYTITAHYSGDLNYVGSTTTAKVTVR